MNGVGIVLRRKGMRVGSRQKEIFGDKCNVGEETCVRKIEYVCVCEIMMFAKRETNETVSCSVGENRVTVGCVRGEWRGRWRVALMVGGGTGDGPVTKPTGKPAQQNLNSGQNEANDQ